MNCLGCRREKERRKEGEMRHKREEGEGRRGKKQWKLWEPCAPEGGGGRRGEKMFLF